ncbi:MAG TPA: type II toxin-antitoxin system prevent-host-death family antitoxin [Actinomycetes bacterium]|nr:type II toxin-antitoxin system prevent-host-death family antitoxin [Actinomycetes bacterium]
MDQVGVRELRLNVSRYLERVEAGETLEVTKRGKVIAVLAPRRTRESARDYLVATGQLVAGSGGLAAVRPVRAKRSITEALASLRADER